MNGRSPAPWRPGPTRVRTEVVEFDEIPLAYLTRADRAHPGQGGRTATDERTEDAAPCVAIVVACAALAVVPLAGCG